MANLATNAALISKGLDATQVMTAPYWSFYICIGGSGSTLMLAFLYQRSRSIHLRTIGKLSIVPALFNINEPLIFGSPVVMNPLLFFPLVLVPMVNATLAYAAMHLNLVQDMIAMAPWTTPAPIGAMISAAWDYRAFVLVILIMLIDGLLWYPFFKAYEKQLVEQEIQSSQVVDAEPASAQS